MTNQSSVVDLWRKVERRPSAAAALAATLVKRRTALVAGNALTAAGELRGGYFGLPRRRIFPTRRGCLVFIVIKTHTRKDRL